MEEKRDLTALDWVLGEISESLNQSRQALEAYMGDVQDATQLRFCLTHLHQVYGSLQMVELEGPTMLAQEMELLTQEMLNGAVAADNTVANTLMRAIVQLPLFLQQIQRGTGFHSSAVFPLVNELRAARGDSLIIDSVGFKPDLSALQLRFGTAPKLLADQNHFLAVAKKLQQMFQFAAASVLRGMNLKDNRDYLNKIFLRLKAISQASPRLQQWDIAKAWLDSLSNEDLSSGLAVRALMRHLHRDIKIISQKGVPALSVAPNQELLRTLLFYVACSTESSDAIRAVRERYALDRAFGGDDQAAISAVSEPQLDTIRSVTKALKEELDEIKQTLEKFNEDSGEVQSLEDMLPVFQRVADTMMVMGVNELPKQVNQIEESLRLKLREGELHGQELMKFAEQILHVEHQLEAIASSGRLQETVDNKTLAALRIDDAQQAVVQESYSRLETVKQSIVEYIASQWDVTHLQETPALLKEIAGGLAIIPLQRAANILYTAARYIDDKLLIGDAGAPQWVELDTLADAISSVEYYLEKLRSGVDNSEDQLLEVAEESLANLGYAVVEIQYVEPVKETPAQEQEQEQEQNQSQLDMPTAAEEVVEDLTAANEEIDLADAAVSEISLSSVQEDEDEDEDEDEVDSEIREIFIEEAAEVIESIDDYFPRWAMDFSDQESLGEFRRAFHTLKGSGRLVKAFSIGELAWSVENMLNRIIDGAIEPNEQQVSLINRVRSHLPGLVEAFAAEAAVENEAELQQLQEWAAVLADGGSVIGLDDKPEAEEKTEEDQASESIIDEGAADAEPLSQEDEERAEEYQLWDIFVSEAEGHLYEVGRFNERMLAAAPLYEAPSDPMQRALHTLKGSAHMAGVTEVAEIATPLEGLAKEMRNYQVILNQDSLQLFVDAREYIQAALEQIKARLEIQIPEKDMFLARVAEQYELNVGHLIHQEQDSPLGSADPSKLTAFMAGGMDLLLDADRLLVSWRAGGPAADVATIGTELHALHEAAEQARLPQVAQLSEQLLAVYKHIPADAETFDAEVLGHLEQGHECILDMLDAVAATQELPLPSDELVAALEADAQNLAVPELSEHIEGEAEAEVAEQEVVESEAAELEAAEEVGETSSEEAEEKVDSEPESDTTEVEAVDESTEATSEASDTTATPEVSEHETSQYIKGLLDAAAAKSEPAIEEPEAEDEVDPEILEIFYEEAEEQIEEIEEAVHDWEEAPNDHQHADELKRILHTLKGGARLAGLSTLGDLAHDFETYLINNTDQASKDPQFFIQVHEYQDRLISKIKSTGEYTGAADADVEQEEAEEQAPKEVAVVEAEQVQVQSQAPVQGEQNKLQVQRSAPQEVIKIPADLLESLVNLAGETSISRGRMEQQVSDWGQSLDEMNSTIVRLQEQLRRLDIETEAQILFRQEQLQQHEDFDPLEMDRYSQLQQLSRSLTESASDLLDLKHTLSDKARDAEQLLLQQSRINTDLQEGLMRSRMVPFSRMVPRLRRIVRQVSTELGKQVNLQMENIEGEMDRSVLERMVTPLEHMLRNAVDHGIESAQERAAENKAPHGRIVLSLTREGGDVLLRLADDGRGIDLEKVKAKAIERGMMAADAQLSDRDIMQFVVQAGFSTAESVTQISGRGVGLDVVSSEIKQLGGAVTINSQQGQGTEFLIRLPFTVSVNRALMVQIGDDSYALPLNTIEGIVRVSPFELEHYYQDPQARFEYADENYKVRYLGEMLGTGAKPKLEDQILPLPVVLVRTTEHVVAIQVDALMGSREIVVKSLGPQFAGVQGLSGATVMGDGSVVVIIDPVALIRRQAAMSYQPHLLSEEPALPSRENDEITVMVVDDSVTVRKVAGRFLERQGYRVITAKDGMEALKVLQDEIPAIMLLDIEMPRMDGFEVAKNVRGSRRLQDLPIIMITSRTGDKHRERAMELGVNKYMGKPYQEEALLENINELIGIVPRALEQA
ncbi:Hpt domain-containing protein [uncultured Pseudoteredinibacter sp.]|uniref:hybrid sensor histidine kinase/response regulator n=1 Tax=uncultured Pseudoteredinibacter sp. TaxID=1641701 RepID=UPI002639661F|nr:Hpt domain-containing protein [uncultured Pseudoteredinibacter sp.]